ncbi:hypothetical protein MKX03_017864, partial [Papaver bracteatum]
TPFLLFDALILHKTKLYAAVLAPFKAYEVRFFTRLNFMLLRLLHSRLTKVQLFLIMQGTSGCQNNPKHSMRCSTC